MPVIIIRDQNDKQTISSQSDDGLGSTLHSEKTSGLSSNAKIAIGVTIPVCLLTALLIAFIVVAERKRKVAKRSGHQSTILQRPKINSYVERKGSRQLPLLQPDVHDIVQTRSTADSKYEKEFEQHELEDKGAEFEGFNFNTEDDNPLPIHPPRSDSIVNSPTYTSPKQDDFAHAREQSLATSQSPTQRHSITDLTTNTNRFSTISNSGFSNRHSTFIVSNRETMITVVDHNILEVVAENRDSIQSVEVQEFTQAPDEILHHTNREPADSGYGIAITETSNPDTPHSTVWDTRRFSQRNPYTNNQITNRISLHPNTSSNPRVSRLASSHYSKSPEGFDFNIPPNDEEDRDGEPSALTPVSETSHPNVYRASQRLSRLDEPGPDPWMRRLSVQEQEYKGRLWLEPSPMERDGNLRDGSRSA